MTLPAPRPRRARHDGWTAARQLRFLSAFERGGSVRAAAAAAGVSRQGAYRFRATPAGAAFARLWDQLCDRASEGLPPMLPADKGDTGDTPDKGDKGDTRRPAAPGGPLGKGDTAAPAQNARLGQSSQSRVDPARRAALMAIIEAASR